MVARQPGQGLVCVMCLPLVQSAAKKKGHIVHFLFRKSRVAGSELNKQGFSVLSWIRRSALEGCLCINVGYRDY